MERRRPRRRRKWRLHRTTAERTLGEKTGFNYFFISVNQSKIPLCRRIGIFRTQYCFPRENSCCAVTLETLWSPCLPGYIDRNSLCTCRNVFLNFKWIFFFCKYLRFLNVHCYLTVCTRMTFVFYETCWWRNPTGILCESFAANERSSWTWPVIVRCGWRSFVISTGERVVSRDKGPKPARSCVSVIRTQTTNV